MNDPRLTDYALGELDPAAREAFERELAASTDLQRELQETIALIEALPAAITMNETLTDPTRETLRKNASENLQSNGHKKIGRRRMFVAGLGALAAGLAATAIIVSHDSGSKPHGEAPAVASHFNTPAPLTTALAVNDDIATRERLDSLAKKPAAAEPAKEAPAQLAAQTAETDGQPSGQESSSREAKLAELSSAVAAAPAEFQAGNAAVANKDEAVIDRFQTLTAKQAPMSAATAAPPASSPMPFGDAISAGAVATLSTRSAGRNESDFSLARGGRSKTAFDTEGYDSVTGNAFLDAQGNPLSTFSIDVDTASYANVRRFLTAGQLPPAGAVRIEELVNYFPYTYPQPEGDTPFSVTTDVTHAPWNEKHLLARIALKGRDVATDKLPASNLVFLVDVSGSMDEPNKLPLLKRSLTALVEKLSPRDRVAIVVYAGSSGLALPSTAGEDKARILEAIDRLEAGGSTNGAEGIQLAYDIARQQFLKEGNNRVILCTDGDFNVGVTSRSELVRLIENERKSGIFLSVLGFGTGNVKDSQMEQLADKGNGNYAYIDTPSEGRKVLVEQMGATLFTIAKDVKIQVEFNPTTVAGYRLIGYENRLLAKEDFNDDTKDAGEIGAGHTVTALYEIVPASQPLPGSQSVDPLKYQSAAMENPKSKIQNPKSPDLFTVKLRYKAPDGETSRLIEKVVGPGVKEFAQAPEDFRFASAVAAFGMKLRGDKSDPPLDWNAIQKIARQSLGDDPGAYRAEFLTLVQKARQLSSDEN